MEDQIPKRPDRSLLIGRQTSKWSLWDVFFLENNSKRIYFKGVLSSPIEDKCFMNFNAKSMVISG